MSWSHRIRTTHRWVSLLFVVAVIAVAVLSSGGEEPPGWVYVFPGGLLAALALSGLYLFALPYTSAGRRSAAARRDRA